MGPATSSVSSFGWVAPTSDDYAALPVDRAFNWSDGPLGLEPGEWYLVAFRSIVRADADHVRLAAYDDRAHAEAARSPGFVHYFKGPLSGDRECLSFCLWTSRAEARRATGRPAHREAVMLVLEMYEEYRLEFLRVTMERGRSVLRLEPYDRPVTGLAIMAHESPASRPARMASLSGSRSAGTNPSRPSGGTVLRTMAATAVVPRPNGRRPRSSVA